MPVGVNLLRADWDLITVEPVYERGYGYDAVVRVPVDEVWWLRFVRTIAVGDPGGAGVDCLIVFDRGTGPNQVLGAASVEVAAGASHTVAWIVGHPGAKVSGLDTYRVEPLSEDAVCLSGQTIRFAASSHAGVDDFIPLLLVYRRYRIDNIVAGRDA